MGEITKAVRAARKKDGADAKRHRDDRRREKEADAARIAAEKLMQRNTNLETQLVPNLVSLQRQINSFEGAGFYIFTCTLATQNLTTHPCFLKGRWGQQ